MKALSGAYDLCKDGLSCSYSNYTPLASSLHLESVGIYMIKYISVSIKMKEKRSYSCFSIMLVYAN